jgi:hypothetical protein
MILMVLILIMMLIIMACSGIARGCIYCVEDGYRWNQHRGRDQ